MNDIRNNGKVLSLKQELLSSILDLKEGAEQTSEKKAEVLSLVNRLEEASPITEATLKKQFNGRWKLIWTTEKVSKTIYHQYSSHV
mmetsp:Transcript_19742/g.31338  ORF Transcript_19742/g.31338 Transcript_19742/m.31338 type:complete len:86 (-) Transcript_19742:529-786(-)